MKKILLALVTLIFSQLSFAAGEFSNCNLPTQIQHSSTTDGIGLASITSLTAEIPQGTCESLGYIGGATTILDCRNAAKQKGYSCYQITTARVQVSSDLESMRSDSIYNLCWACLK